MSRDFDEVQSVRFVHAGRECSIQLPTLAIVVFKYKSDDLKLDGRSKEEALKKPNGPPDVERNKGLIRARSAGVERPHILREVFFQVTHFTNLRRPNLHHESPPCSVCTHT